MKNNKGFVMAEALIVSAVVLTTLVLIYSQFAKINKYYGESYYYDNVNDIYALDRIFSYLEDESLLSIYNDVSTYLDITDCNLTYYTNKDYCTKLFHYANINKLYIAYNNRVNTYNSMSSINDISVRFLDYINNIDDTDTTYTYRLLAEFNDGTYASIPVGQAAIMLGNGWFDEISNDGIAKNDILSITTQDYIHYNGTYNKVYDVSVQHNDKVRAYLIDTETTGKYNIVLAGTNGVYANPDSSELFKDFQYLNKLDLSKFYTSRVTDMNRMFNLTGYSNTTFTMNLGDNFDTSNVTDMQNMFRGTGYSSTIFTLNLGDKFDTSKVKDMSNMFYMTGYNSTLFKLDLGDNFNTSNVEDMTAMFYATAYNCQIFTLDLGVNFDTSKVENMQSMFYATGYKSTLLTLDLGDKFDTSKVKSMKNMFWVAGMNNKSFTLNLGNKFNTSKVENMSYMFRGTGYYSTVFTLNLGNKFDTSRVTNMDEMFTYTGFSTNNLVIDISQFNLVSNPTVVNFFGDTRNKAITFLVKDASTQTYLSPAVITNVTVSIKP